MTRPKVYIPNRGGHDYSAAAKYGQLVYVTEGLVPRWNLSEMYRSWVAVLETSSPEDYILETSLNSLCSVGAACFAYKHGKLNLLLFKDGAYIERKLLIDDLIRRSYAKRRSETVYPPARTPQKKNGTDS